ncbi:hypothetical protein Q4E93_03260 [Flavitalea sp. BT771]|uniref:hypothetical protein n=1 Tax=Flavitalea sp. BT771 TaxID=3063329 RepID=UPI0026E220BA|nr:hypothetical protein [Flavitalea sp. BT771]MDO6429593.1 hypothetical protein [Flavitalea sp. BT771]MDV6218279.1 hypothetical protein [Flavitalea sp. BT771]
MIPKQGNAETPAALVMQAKGFNRINNKLPAEFKDDDPEKRIDIAGNKVWDSVFKDDKIDKAGGVIAEHKHSDDKVGGEATTAREKDLPFMAFGLVELTGDVKKGTGIDRWSLKAVSAEASDELIFTPETLIEHAEQVKAIIFTALSGGKADKDASKDTTQFKGVDDFITMFKPMADWCADNPERVREIVVMVYQHLLKTMIARKGQFTREFCETISSDTDDPFSGKLYDGMVSGLKLKGLGGKKVVPTPVTLPLEEVVMHEFGHIGAGLLTTEESVEGQKKSFKPQLQSAVILAQQLSKILSEGLPDRALMTNLRFAWARNVTDWYKIKDGKGIVDGPKTTDALKIMQNIFMSIEEYMNIMDIDNQKADTKEGMRLKHGTEHNTSMQIGEILSPDLEKTLANQPKTQVAKPLEMADTVWREKLELILKAFIQKYSH